MNTLPPPDDPDLKQAAETWVKEFHPNFHSGNFSDQVTLYIEFARWILKGQDETRSLL